MRRTSAGLAVLALALSLIAACGSDSETRSGSEATARPSDPPEGMELIWSDEFDGDEIDQSNWTYDIGGWGWGNGEAQHYTDRPTNARTQNGLLVIELHQEQFESSYYTSARLKTRSPFWVRAFVGRSV